jgi:hypothetical protein
MALPTTLHALGSAHHTVRVTTTVRDAAYGRALARAGIERLFNPHRRRGRFCR